MNRRPTIIDVAKTAGVSKSTVSLVLQNSPLVKDDTRAQVRQAMAEIGYVYNRAAAKLRSDKTGLVGLVINDMRNPFFTEFATSVQMTLAARGYVTVAANSDDDPMLQADVVRAMIEHGVSAMVISPAYGGGSETFEAICRAGIPCLQVLRNVAPAEIELPFAAPDYRSGTETAVRHLVDQGARRIAFVGGVEGKPVTQERVLGYQSVLAGSGMEPLILPGRASRKLGKDAIGQLIRQHPDVDAVMCFNDLIGLGMLAGCAQMGLPVGDALKIVGFDDIDESADSFPGLSSVRCDIAGFGAYSAETILAWLEKGQRPQRESRTPVSLMVRGSSQP